MPNNDSPPPGFLFYLTLGLIVGGFCVSSTVQSIRYANQGKRTVATISDCFTSGRTNSPTCHYDFQVGAEKYSGSVGTFGYQQGSSIPIVYLANDPTNNTASPPNWFPAGFLELVGAIVLLGFALRQFMSTDDIIND